MVARVTEQGPADKAKIQQGDVVIRFDGKEVTDMRRLPRLVAETPVEKNVKVIVWRKGKEVVLEVKLGELDENDQVAAAPRGSKPSTPMPSAPSVDALGMQLSQLTPELREKFEVSEKTKGVLVTKVEDGSTAAERGIRAGDVIVEVAQEEVTAPAQVAKKVTEANTQGRRSVLVMVERQGEQRFVGLPVDNKK